MKEISLLNPLLVVLCSFTKNASLKVHKAAVKGNKQFVSTFCDSSFAEKNKLKTHISSVYEGKKPFKCNICDSYLTRNESLKARVDSVHEGKRLARKEAFSMQHLLGFCVKLASQVLHRKYFFPS